MTAPARSSPSRHTPTSSPTRAPGRAPKDEITLHLSSKDITLKVVDKNTLEGNAADFDIADFDTINFDFYG
jgi:hypothetical protein